MQLGMRLVNAVQRNARCVMVSLRGTDCTSCYVAVAHGERTQHVGGAPELEKERLEYSGQSDVEGSRV